MQGAFGSPERWLVARLDSDGFWRVVAAFRLSGGANGYREGAERLTGLKHLVLFDPNGIEEVNRVDL